MSSMFRRLATRSVPATPRSSSSSSSPAAAAPSASCQDQQQLDPGSYGYIKPKPLIRQQWTTGDNNVDPHLAGSHGVNFRMPLETALSLLDGFAKSLLLDKPRRIQLKSKCMGTFVKELDSESDNRGASILHSAHTVLTYMSWAIQHFEKAAAGVAADDESLQELNGELLDKAERMLGTLAESLDSRGFTAAVPNAHLLGLAYLYLALIWKLRRTLPSPQASSNNSHIASSIKNVATHLLEMFIVCPKYARLCYAPELWVQLFKPSLSGVEAWYRKEYNTITNYSRSLSAVIRSSPCSPNTQEPAQQQQQQREQEHQLAEANFHTTSSGNASARHTIINTSSKPLQLHLQSQRHSAVTNKREEKIKMQISLLYDLYEDALDEGTQDYALHYRGQVMGYNIKTNRIGSVQEYGKKPNNYTAISDSQGKPTSVKQQDSREAIHPVNEDNAPGSRRFTWLSPTKPLQFRRSLHNAIFGTLFAPDKPDKETPSPSFLRFCNKELPDIQPYQDISPSSTKNSRGRISRYRPQPIIEEESCLAAADDATYGGAGADLINNTGFFHKRSSTQSDNHVSLRAGFSNVNRTPADAAIHHESEIHTAAGRNSSKRLIDLIEESETETAQVLFRKALLTADQQHPLTASNCTSLISLTNIMETWDSKEAASKHNFQQSNHSRNEDTSQRDRVSSTSVSASRTRRSSFSTAENTLREKLLMEQRHGRSNLISKKHMLPPEGNMQGSTFIELRKSSSSTTKCSTDVNVRTSNATVKGPGQKKIVQKKLLALGDEKDELQRLVQELHAIVAEARESKIGVDRCEEVLLRLSQAWLECNAAAATHARAVGIAHPLVSGRLSSSTDLVHDLLYVLATSELPEAQRLSLCLLSTSIASCNKKLSMDESNVKTHYTAPTVLVDPNLLCVALSHLLNQDSNRLPEAALLLHLLHPSLACSHLPQLLPLLLDIAQRTTSTAFSGAKRLPISAPEEKAAASRFPDAELSPRALALKIASQLLCTADLRTRLHSCKHILFPHAFPCLLRSLDSHDAHLDERVAAASILTICFQTLPDTRQCILKQVSASSAVMLLQRSACSMGSFKTAIDFVAELMGFNRIAYWTQIMGHIRREGLLNCIHALMVYIQNAPLEHQPAAAGLLLHMDLLSAADHSRYSVFREEALNSIVAALSSGNNEASLNAARTLLTMSRAGALFPASAEKDSNDRSGCMPSDRDQGLEAWLLSKAGLGTQHDSNEHFPAATISGPWVDADAEGCTSQECSVTSKEELNCCGATRALDSWDRKVAEALLGYGEPLMCALAKRLQSSGVGEVRKACLVVATWLSCYLAKLSSSTSSCSLVAASARKVESNSGQLSCGMTKKKKKMMKGVMRETLESELEAIAVANAGSAIEERVFAALALQNLLSTEEEEEG